MLVQSHRKDDQGNFIIEVLPAIPDAWSQGKVSGLLVRGGFEIGFEWLDHKVVALKIASKTGGGCSLYVNGKTLGLTLKKGEERELGDL